MTSPGRAVYPHQAGDITALWQPAADGAVVALIAGPRFRSRTWLAPLGTPAGLDVTFVNPDLRHTRTASGADTPLLRRAAADTGLPWTLVFADAPATSGSEDDGARRTVILAGLGLLMVVVASGAVIVARGVAHELEVARLQSDFVSAVSHEFRTPLTSLQQFTELLNDAPEPPSEKRRLFYLAQARAVGRLQHLVETLLDFGRMEAGAYTYRMTRVAVETLVTAVVHTFRRDGAPTDFVVGCRIDPACGDVVADDEALGRALRNLLENAVKYSGDGRRIDVLAERVGDTVAISVRDEGLGVPHAEQSRIFTKFVRGASSRTYGINGSGIGLAMVREIVRAHDGDITVESDGRRGSTFTVRLPAAQAATDDCARDRVS
ncbi:hypothetical protein TBR22_A49640 [Luteitalea sp. TBR-22]|uniref:sensor histidine kinase n=1 Tax=Luteitalea sp. TBR-22 TaxID=2802971 RepID=UPI001AF178EA|nr:HAMP domain-containing sensor histidine kinase [Luteitalea sp. TBR-22]BCS35730.1 hypothetical protein TBR22_A49640 [Luteitalea sp. TBR-22]